MDLGTAGRVAIVAGGSRGIRATGGEVTGVVADMTTASGVDVIFDAACKAYGNPDILVVNAPAPLVTKEGHLRGFENCDDEDYVAMFDSFVLSQVRLTRKVLPSMKRKGWGRLLNIGSIAFKTPHQEDPLPANDVRIASAPLQRILAHEYGRYGITANTIATGPFNSELAQAYLASGPIIKTREWYLKMLPVGRWGEPIEMGWLAAFLCSDRAAFLTGEVIRLDGGYTKSLF